MNRLLFLFTIVYSVAAVTYQGSCSDDQVLCEQLCITLSSETYECGCWNDHYLLNDGISCRLNSSPPLRTFRKLSKEEAEGLPRSRPLAFHGNNYAEYPLIDSAYLETNITIEFKMTEQKDGLLFFAGQLKGDDFLSISIVGPNIIFRHDCGEGTIEDLYRGPFAVDQWHNLTVMRRYCDKTEMRADRKTRMLDLTEQFKFYKGISMDEGMFLGGAPQNIQYLETKAGVSRGFTGCIRKLIVNDEKILISSERINKVMNPKSLVYCSKNPTALVDEDDDENEDVEELQIPTGTEPPKTERVLQYVDHRAVDVSGRKKISTTTTTTTTTAPTTTEAMHLLPPADKQILEVAEFGGSNILTQPAPMDVLNFIELVLHFKSQCDTCTMMLWRAEEKYMHVYLERGYVNVEVSMGSDTIVLRSESAVSMGQWHKTEIWRTGRGVLLKVGRQSWVEGTLNSLGRDSVVPGEVHIGGHEEGGYRMSAKRMPKFVGCMRHIHLSGHRLSLYSAPGVKACGVNACVTARCPDQCLNTVTEAVCLCPWPSYGYQCSKKSSEALTAMNFNRYSQLKLSNEKIMNQIIGDTLKFTIEFKLSNVTEAERSIPQLLVYAGESPMKGDFFKMTVTPGGHFVFGTNLGSGMVELSHPTSLLTERWYSVTVMRDKRNVRLSLNDEATISTMAPSGSEQLNVFSPIYIGSHPDSISNGHGFRGCIESLTIGSTAIFNPKQADQAVNIEDCWL